MAFIGIDNLTHVKDKLQTNIIMGPAYYSADELKRMAIKVITGVEFKDTATIFNRKGGTARRKVVGQSQNSTLGYMTERTLEAHIVWDHYTANEDDFQEKPVMITINGSAQPSFPKTEEFIDQIGIAFNDNVFPCVWHGDENSDKPEMALFNGLHADLDKDIANGDVSEAAGNLIPCAVLDAPAQEGDSAAWEEFVKWYNKWHPALKRRETIVYMSTAYGNHIADAYEQKHRSHQAVQFIPDANGNFKVREYPKVTFCPSDDFGDGTRMIATIPGNMELGVNSTADQSFVSIMHGDPTPGGDHKTITFQIQGIFGTRILRIEAPFFCTNGGTIEDKYWSGDYQKDSFTVVANNSEYGTVSVSPEPVNGEYAKGTTLTITATPKAGYKFVKWAGASNATTATANVVTKGQPESAVAIFEAEGGSSSD